MTSTTKRASATVAILASESKRRQRDVLERLAGQLQGFDNLVLVGPRHDPASPSPWRTRRASGGLVQPPARPEPRDLVLVLDDRVLPSEGFLDALVDAMADPLLGAVAARSNVADGDELVLGVPYQPGDATGRRAALRSWAVTHPATTTLGAHLGGPCILLRRRHLDQIGGLEALRSGVATAAALDAARAEGLGVGVAEGAYAHHPGGAPRRNRSDWPLVSACLIVKDEEDDLAACLASAQGLADEVVVYDTGSTDGTVGLARGLGARVIEGSWDGDFSRARNAALEACRGQWILWLDADERLVCDDPAGLSELLEAATSEVEGYVVLIDNLQGNEAAPTLPHPAVRLFRRAACQWEGRLHEQVVRRHDQRAPQLRPLDAARIEHRGYLQAALRGRDKGARNIRSAFADLAGGSALEFGLRLLSLGRSYVLAGDYETGIDLAQRARELAEHPTTARLALRTLADAYSALGRHDEALAAASELRRITRQPVLADLIEGRVHLETGDPEKALVSLARLREVVVDDDGFEYRPGLTAGMRASALLALGRHGEAADVLLATLREDGGLDTHLGLLVEAIEKAGRDLGEIYAALPASRLTAFLPQLLQLQPEAADRVLEAWHGADADSIPVLATATQLGTRLPVARRLLWSARIRRAGLTAACPLVHSAAFAGLPAHDRALAAAVAWASFGDARAHLGFVASALEVEPAGKAQLREEVEALAPALLGTLDGLAATRPPAQESPAVTQARRVVVVSRCSSGLREAALSATLARQGDDVTLLQPEPGGAAAPLAPRRVLVRTWNEADPSQWERSCLAALAHHYAAHPVDGVVLGRGVESLQGRVAGLMPLAEVCLDGPDGSPGAAIAGPVKGLVGNPPPTPLASRAGICILSDLRAAHGAGSVLLGTGGLTRLAEALPGAALVHCGDDPEHLLKSALPALLVPGPASDPTPWVRASRAVLLDGEATLEERRELAELCGTPVVVARQGALDAAIAELSVLLTDDHAWRQASEAASARARDQPDATSAGQDPLPRSRERRPPRRLQRSRPLVRIASPVGSFDSLAQVNRELARHLAAKPRPFDLVVATPEPLPLPGAAATALGKVPVHPLAKAPLPDLEIRHQWPPDFRPPSNGARLVCVQPFEFGGLPEEWIGPLRDVVDELWVPTPWVRQCAIDSGVAPEKVQLVPYGIDTDRFRPDGPRYPLRTTKATKLLFVGGCIERKGIDALLQAYLSTFSADDDVCLVVKPYGSGGVYRTSNLEGDVRRAAAAGGAEIELVDETLDGAELAALYRSCDALAHPFRGEGFALPVAEAMASGLPVVVTEGGACDAYCDDEVAWLVPSRKVAITPSEWTPSKAGAWWLEPSRTALGAALRGVVEQPELARRRGAAGAARIAAQLTWKHAADEAADRIEAILLDAGSFAGAGDRLAPSQRGPRRSS